MTEIFNASKQSQSQTNSEESIVSSSTTDNNWNNKEESGQERLSPFELVDRYSKVMKGEKPSKNPLDAYAPKPLTIFSFDSQLEGEYVLLLLRKHPITQVKKILLVIGMILAPLLFTKSGLFSSLTGSYQTATLIFWYLLTLGYAFESFLTWFYNVYIVTDERIIDIDFLSLIYKNVAIAKLDKIEDITAVTTGAAQSMFNFGTVEIQTSAEQREFEFELVPQPSKVTQFLHEMLVEEEREKMEGRIS